MEYNGSVPFAKGWEGIAQVGVQLPIFNRNQGEVTAARADIALRKKSSAWPSPCENVPPPRSISTPMRG
jgi:hypothetical protein